MLTHHFLKYFNYIMHICIHICTLHKKVDDGIQISQHIINMHLKLGVIAITQKISKCELTNKNTMNVACASNSVPFDFSPLSRPRLQTTSRSNKILCVWTRFNEPNDQRAIAWNIIYKHDLMMCTPIAFQRSLLYLPFILLKPIVWTCYYFNLSDPRL